MTEPPTNKATTTLKLADLTASELRNMLATELSGVIDRMIEHGSEVSNAYNSERIKKLGDRLDKASEHFQRMQSTIAKQDEQIHELRRELDKLRGVVPEKPVDQGSG